ncbi:hypothetical protein [Borreliella tanukii]
MNLLKEDLRYASDAIELEEKFSNLQKVFKRNQQPK